MEILQPGGHQVGVEGARAASHGPISADTLRPVAMAGAVGEAHLLVDPLDGLAGRVPRPAQAMGGLVVRAGLERRRPGSRAKAEW